MAEKPDRGLAQVGDLGPLVKLQVVILLARRSISRLVDRSGARPRMLISTINNDNDHTIYYTQTQNQNQRHKNTLSLYTSGIVL